MRSALPLVVVVALARSAAALPELAIHPAGTPFEGPADFEPTSIWWNPAALAALRGWHFQFNGGFAARQGSIDRAAIDSASGLPGGAGDRTFPSASTRDVSFRYFGVGTYDFGLDTLTFGLSVSAPWDTSLSFTDDHTGSTAALPTAYHLASESFRDIFFSIALALKLHPKWLVGVAISPVDSFADYTFYRDTALDGGMRTVKQASPLCGGAACGYENPQAAARIQVHGDGGSFWAVGQSPGIPIPLGLAMNWGIAFRPVERLWMGVSWQHVFPLSSHGSGYEKAYEAPGQLGAQVTPPPGLQGACPGGTCVGAGVIGYSLPDVFHVGARIAVRDDLEIATWGRLTMYGGYGTSSDPALKGLVVRLGTAAARAGIPEQVVIAHDLRTAFAAEAGVRWRALPSLRLGLSLTVESSSAPAGLVDADLIDAPKVDATVGAEWHARRWLRFQLAYGLTAWVPVDGGAAFDPNARIRCVDGGGSIDACDADLNGRGLPTAAGHYTQLMHHLMAGAAFDF